MFAYTKLMQAMAAAGVVSATDPYFNLTTLLLNTSSTNGAQNNTFLDSSSSPLTITRNGNTTQGTFTPFSQTGWSNYFGSSNYLTTPSSSAFNLSSGDWTIEGWFYLNSNSDDTRLFTVVNSSTDMYGSYVRSGTVYIGKIGFSEVAFSTINLNTWNHIAFCKTSTSTITCYINGTSAGSTTSYTLPNANCTIYIAASPANYALATTNGYISNFRVVKGTAVYTSAFTPSTTPLTAISGTSLLTCQSNRFVDNSASPLTLTVTGTPSVQAFSPFAPTAAYDAAVVGGSGYFDGSGDFLQIADSTSLDLTGDYTIEMWMYATATPVSTTFLQLGSSSNYLVMYLSSSTKYITIAGSLSITASTALVLNTWNHIALVRNGSGTNNTVLYLNGVNVGQATNTTSFTGSASNGLRIGAEYPSDFYFNGYISSSRLVNGTAVYTAAFTPPTAPPTAITNTQLLLNFTNSGIYDSTAKNVLETVGNAQVSTTQAKWGTTSMAFDGTGDYLTSASKPLFDLGKGDWTIEFWLNPTAPAVAAGVITRIDNTGNKGWGILYYPNYLSFVIGSGSASIQSATSSITAGSWQHVAITRSGTSGKIFINGTQSGSTGTINDFTDATTLLGIGALSTVTGWNGDYYLTGYIDDLRITKGYARYTTTFTPPTAAFPLQ